MAKDVFLGDPMLDRIMKVVVSLARELYVAKDRINVLEKVLQDKGTFGAGEVDYYEADSEQSKAWLAARDAYIARVLGPLIDDAAADTEHRVHR